LKNSFKSQIDNFKDGELAKEFLNLATEKETKIATVKVAMKEYLEKGKKEK
jgi:hypothetical protein